MEQSPVSLRESLQEFAHFKVITGHGPDQRDQFLAHVLGDGFLVHLDREVIAPLGGVFMEGALEQVQGVVDLVLELFLAELENFDFFAHKYAYIYAYYMASKSGCQGVNRPNNAKNPP